jgi:hypothetical protein
MKFAIVKNRLRQQGQPGTTTPGPPSAMLGSQVRNVLKSYGEFHFAKPAAIRFSSFGPIRG